MIFVCEPRGSTSHGIPPIFASALLVGFAIKAWNQLHFFRGHLLHLNGLKDRSFPLPKRFQRYQVNRSEVTYLNMMGF